MVKLGGEDKDLSEKEGNKKDTQFVGTLRHLTAHSRSQFSRDRLR